MLTDYVLPEVQAHGLGELWFLQDGATSHTARETMELLRHHFGEYLISCFASVNWPPRSCDITLLVYFLCRYVKSGVFRNKPATIDALEANITPVIHEIPVDLLLRVVQNLNI